MEELNSQERYYTHIEETVVAQIAVLSRRIIVVSWLRLAVVIVALIGIWWLWDDMVAVVSVIAICVVLFLALIKLHNRMFAAKLMQKFMKKAASDNLKRVNLQLDGLDGGMEYVDSHHSYSYDLDLYGNRLIFSLLNATATRGGRDLLAGHLSNTAGIVGDIEQRQDAVKELAGLSDFRMKFQALGNVARMEDESGKGLSDDNDNGVFRGMKLRLWQKTAMYILPAAMLLLIVLATIGYDVSLYIEAVFVMSVIVAALGAKQVGRLHTAVDRIVKRVSIYHELLNEIEQSHFSSSLLQRLQAQLGDGQEKASTISHKLARLLSNLDQRYNWLSYLILNAMLQWDYHQVDNVMRWMERYYDKIGQWERVLSSVDELCALATFSFNNPNYIFPVIDRGNDLIIEARGLGHPLISANRCVCNDVSSMSSGNFIVVTGANMAGKSTYLRAVGVNYLLALVGAPVFAAEMSVGVASLFTGLRTTDSLNDNESYFFAELRRLQTVVVRAEAGERMLVILDEILKGTNSTDKQKGSLALVSKLVRMNVAGIIATHDLVLGTLADRFPKQVFNRCFEAEISGETLQFDYTLHQGVAQNLNAYFLMQRMGIV